MWDKVFNFQCIEQFELSYYIKKKKKSGKAEVGKKNNITKGNSKSDRACWSVYIEELVGKNKN